MKRHFLHSCFLKTYAQCILPFLMDASELEDYLEMKFVFMKISFERMKVNESLCLGFVLLGSEMQS